MVRRILEDVLIIRKTDDYEKDIVDNYRWLWQKYDLEIDDFRLDNTADFSYIYNYNGFVYNMDGFKCCCNFQEKFCYASACLHDDKLLLDTLNDITGG